VVTGASRQNSNTPQLHHSISRRFSILTAYPASVFAQLILIFVLTFFISLITDQVLLIHVL